MHAFMKLASLHLPFSSSKPPSRFFPIVGFDLSRNVSYDPNSVQHLNSQAKSSAAIELATAFQANLPSESPSFIKVMLPSHVTSCFCLCLPKKFCDEHLPKIDETIVLVDEDEQEFETKYLAHKNGLSSGWQGFSIAHKLLEGDALVFQLIEHRKFQVYIVRVNGLDETDGIAPCGVNLKNEQERGLVVFDQSEDDGAYEEDSAVFEKLGFSESFLGFKDIKGIEAFSIVVDGLVIDSEIPKYFLIKYYNLCCSQKTHLHENLLKGLNVRLVVGIIVDTVTISDAIRGCKVTITRNDLKTWDKTLKAFEEIGMNVGFLRARISRLVGLLFESKEILAAKRNEQMKAKEDMRMINEKLCRLKQVITNLDVEIQNLILKDYSLSEVAGAPW